MSTPCKYCKRKHHTLLHEFLSTQDKAAPDLRGAEVQLKAFPTHEEEDQRQRLLLQNLTTSQEIIPSEQDLEAAAAMIPENHRINYFRCYKLDSPSEVISLRFALVTLANVETRKNVTIGALMDDGANMTIISERVATLLNLKGERHEMSVLGVGGKMQSHMSLETVIKLQSVNGSIKKECSYQITT